MRIVLKKPLDRLIMKAYYSTKNERDKKCKTLDFDFFNLLQVALTLHGFTLHDPHFTRGLYFYPHEESHEGLRATVLQSQTYAKVSENLVSARF